MMMHTDAVFTRTYQVKYNSKEQVVNEHLRGKGRRDRNRRKNLMR